MDINDIRYILDNLEINEIISIILYIGFIIYTWFIVDAAISKKIIGTIVLTLCFLIIDVIFQTKSFTGDPDKDAQIMNERVMEDGEDPNEVMNELINFYIEEGYGMQRAKDALNRVGNY